MLDPETAALIKLENEAEIDEVSRKVAETELRETPERVSESIRELRRLLQESQDLSFDDSDEFLTIFLRPCKFYPESALALMRRLAEFREKNYEILKNVAPSTEQDSFMNSDVVNVLVNRDQHRRRILLMSLGKAWNPTTLNTDKLFRLLYLIHFGAIMEPLTQIHGAVIIMDFAGLSTKNACAFTPAFSNRLLTFIQKAAPVRLKAIHIVNEPFVFNIIWTLFKRFIETKLESRIFLHGTKKNSLLKHIDPDCLPENFGGTLPAIAYNSANWYPILAEHETTIKVWHSYGLVKKDKPEAK